MPAIGEIIWIVRCSSVAHDGRPLPNKFVVSGAVEQGLCRLGVS